MERGRKIAPQARICRRIGVMLAMVLFGLAHQAQGMEMPALYTVEVPIDSTQSNAQTEAYRAALADVIVRVTGTTAIVESAEMATMFPNPAQFVMQYRPGQNNTIIVSLDGQAIERTLRQAGAAVWGSDRPLTLVWLAVDWGQGEREIVGADDPGRLPGDARSIDRNKRLRERILQVAERRGIPIAFPLLDTEDIQNVSFSDIWGGFDERLLSASARYEATSILAGRIKPDDLQPNRWSWFLGQDNRMAWNGEPEEAIGLLADALAAEFMINPNQSIDTIRLAISGIHSVVAYGRVQRYLENLKILDKLIINSVSADTIIYEVEVQGGVPRLSNALKQSGMLDPVIATSVIDTRSFGVNGGPFDSGLQRAGDVSTLEYRYRLQDN
jgi:hypothetical protein